MIGIAGKHPANAGHDIEDRLQQSGAGEATAVCATVIPSSDHTTTSTRSAMVPRNLRVRMVMDGNVLTPEPGRALRAGRGGL